MPGNPAHLLIFSRPLEAPEAKSRLLKSTGLPRSFIQRLHQTLVQDTLRLAEVSKFDECCIGWACTSASCFLPQERLPTNRCKQFLQEGDDFAQRLAHAGGVAAGAACADLIIIGSDCPYLTADTLESARCMCSRGQLVLGPAQEGGFYLLGLPAGAEYHLLRGCFSAGLESVAVTESYPKYPLSLLPILPDIDIASDLATLIGWSQLVAKLAEDDPHRFKETRNLILEELEIDPETVGTREKRIRLRKRC